MDRRDHPPAPADRGITAFSTWSLAELHDHLPGEGIVAALSRETLRRIRRAGCGAGRPPRRGRPRPTRTSSTHDLRHHYASVLLAAGESVIAVAERLGQDKATMVIKVYGHQLPDSEDRTRRALDEAWSAPAAEAPRPRDGPDDLRQCCGAGQDRV